MKRDIFRRGNRMVHKFGEIEGKDDPLFGSHSSKFEPQFPVGIGEHRSPPITSKQYGEHDMFSPSRSQIQKPGGGLASFSGPKPDLAELVAAPVPVGTKKRKSGGK